MTEILNIQIIQLIVILIATLMSGCLITIYIAFILKKLWQKQMNPDANQLSQMIRTYSDKRVAETKDITPKEDSYEDLMDAWNMEPSVKSNRNGNNHKEVIAEKRVKRSLFSPPAKPKQKAKVVDSGGLKAF
jgi:hypothetical protein